MDWAFEQPIKDAGLKITNTRRLILDLFNQKSFALSYNDIEKGVKESLDKATDYRTLKTFEEKNIIHSIYDHSNQLKYALTHQCCSSEEEICNHAHFRCKKCEQTTCIDDLNIPKVNLPKGFKMTQSFLLIEGICERCNK